ncbi:MAG TPA: RNA polymerase sigma factor [Phycisphaerae bacterium]|nr:RNA polymerase sigma factor [Phycisphaerae bacterium]HRW55217.1 RNA polymerase sigma factor [Phycisphaerae bacterium]
MESQDARSELLKKIAKGDEGALQTLLQEYHAPVLNRVSVDIEARMQRYVDPEDILQETYITAFRSFRDYQFNAPGAFYRWVERIALARLQDTLRDLQRKKRDVRRNLHPGSAIRAPSADKTSVIDLFGRIHAGHSTPSGQVARLEIQGIVLTAVARLKDDQRRVIRMRFLEDRAVAEIAAATGKSEDAVYATCSRALKALRAFTTITPVN